MATVLSPGDLAIVQYNSSTTDSFTFVFARDIEAGTVVNFTDNGYGDRNLVCTCPPVEAYGGEDVPSERPEAALPRAR